MADPVGARFRIALDLIECATRQDSDKLVDLLAEKVQPLDLETLSPADEPEIAMLAGLCLDLAQTAGTLLLSELKGRDLDSYWRKNRDVTSLAEMERDIHGEDYTGPPE